MPAENRLHPEYGCYPHTMNAAIEIALLSFFRKASRALDLTIELLESKVGKNDGQDS